MNITRNQRFLRFVVAVIALTVVLPISVPVEAQSTTPSVSVVNPNPTITTPTSVWQPESDNGWWPSISPNGRYVAYGNWGDSWVTDLQTKQTWNFNRPEGLPQEGRCGGGQWITGDTVTFVCDSIPGEDGFYRYEVKVGEWVARKTNDDPDLVAANAWVAQDGHWVSILTNPRRIAKDNQLFTRAAPGGNISIDGETLVHSCTNTNRTICVWQGDKKTKTYTARVPNFGTDVYKNHIVYGGAHGIDPKGKDYDLSVVKGMFESPPKIVPVNGEIWVATNAWPADGVTSVIPNVEQFMLIRPWGERSSIIVEAAAAVFDIKYVGSSFILAYNDDRGRLTVKTFPATSPRSDICGSACPESPLANDDATMKIVAQKDLGAGTFPDVTFYQNKLWLAMQIEGKLRLYSFNKNLTGQQVIDLPFSGSGQAFPRLMVWKDILWVAYRNGDNSSGDPESIKLWRGDNNQVEDIAGGMGNDPVALGNGYIAWQQLQANGRTWKIVRRSVEGGNVSVLRNSVPTGLSRILPNGRVITIDEDRNAVSWGVNSWQASPLTVATDITPTDDNGVVGRFNNNAQTEFNLWAGQRAHTPHAASDGNGTYAIATWNPTARVAVITGPKATTSTTPTIPGNPAPVCDPWPEDTEEILACNFYELTNPSPKYYEPATDPANPAPSGVQGANGLSVAFNSKDSTILVVGGSGDVTAQLQNAQDQALIGGKVTIDQSGSLFAGSPKAIYNSETDQFFVIWSDERPQANSYNIWGRILNGDGSVVGSDFIIARNTSNDFSHVTHDYSADAYIVTYERNGIIGRTVSHSGNLGAEKTILTSGAVYAGQGSVALNENLNEYWLTYIKSIEIIENGRKTGDQNWSMLQRLSKNLEKVGEPIQLSNTNMPVVGGPSISCSKSDQGCMVVWGWALGLGGRGIYGVSVSDLFEVSEESEFITPNTAQYGKQFGAAVVNYNPWTDSFFLTAGDDAGGVALCNFNYGSNCDYVTQVIAPTVFASNTVNKVLAWLGVYIAKASPGNFYPTNTVTNFGASVYASKDQNQIHGVNYATQSVAQSNSSVATPTTSDPSSQSTQSGGNPCTIAGLRANNNSFSTLPQCINQIYVWSLGLAALLALLMTIAGGYIYMTASGNAEKTAKGQEYIWGASIGLALLFTAYLLLRTINPDLTNFSTRSLQLLEQDPPPPTTNNSGSIRGE